MCSWTEQQTVVLAIRITLKGIPFRNQKTKHSRLFNVAGGFNCVASRQPRLHSKHLLDNAIGQPKKNAIRWVTHLAAESAVEGISLVLGFVTFNLPKKISCQFSIGHACFTLHSPGWLTLRNIFKTTPCGYLQCRRSPSSLHHPCLLRTGGSSFKI